MLSTQYVPVVSGGLARHVAELSQALAAQGLEVTVITEAPAPEKRRSRSRESGVDVIRATPTPGPAPLDFLDEVKQSNFALVREAVAAHQRHPFDLVHAHDWLVAFAAQTLKHAFRLPLVATIHATEAGRCRGNFSPMQRYIHQTEWLLSYEAWRVIVCSRAMWDEVRREFSCPADKMHLIPNGVDLRKFEQPGQKALSACLARPGESAILFVGRLVWEKGLQVAIRALRLLREGGRAARLFVVGTGDTERYREIARDEAVAGAVEFLGYLDDAALMRTYRDADVVVIPSLYEPFGIVALEALGAGKPTVVSDVGGLADIVEDGVTGRKVPPDDPQALAEAIAGLLTSPSLMAKLGASGREMVERRYAWPAIATQTRAVYDQVLRERREAQWRDPVHDSGG